MASGALAIGGAGIAMLLAGWQNVRAVLGRFRTVFISVTPIYNAYLPNTVAVLRDYKKVGIGDCYYYLQHSNSYCNGSAVMCDTWSQRDWILFTPWPVLLRWQATSEIVLTHIRGTFNVKRFTQQLQQAQRARIDRDTQRCEETERALFDPDARMAADWYPSITYVTGSLGQTEKPMSNAPAGPSGEPSPAAATQGHLLNTPWLLDEISTTVHKAITAASVKPAASPFYGLYYPKSVTVLEQRLRSWLHLRDWYKARGIPWRMGALLAGAPGTGKTSYVTALARKYKLPVVVFQLSTIGDAEFRDRYRGYCGGSPCVLLFEDIDVFFRERKSQQQNMLQAPLTMSTFLNVLDGCDSFESVFIVATTNDVDALDPALQRPFRFGAPIRFQYLDRDCAQNIAHDVLLEYPELQQQLMAEFKEQTVTGATFKAKYVELALARKWTEAARDHG